MRERGIGRYSNHTVRVNKHNVILGTWDGYWYLPTDNDNDER